MRLTDKSLLSELVVPLLIGLLAFLMMLVGNTLYDLLERMMQEKWPVAYVARVLLFNVPTVLVRTLPIAGAVGASLAFSRLARDNELTALRSVGVSLRRTLAPLVLVGLLLTAADSYVFEKVVPWAWKEQTNLQSLLFNLPENAIEAATTVSMEGYVFSFAKAEGKRVNGQKSFRVYDTIILEQPDGTSSLPRISTAAVGDYQQGRFTFRDVAVHAFRPDGTTDYDLQAEREEVFVQLESMKGGLAIGDAFLENLSSAELMATAQQLRLSKSDDRAVLYEVARWRKLGLPALCLPLTLFAVPLSVRFGRTGTFAALLLSLIIVFLAVMALTATELAAHRGLLPPLAAALLPAALFTAAAFALLRRLE